MLLHVSCILISGVPPSSFLCNRYQRPRSRSGSGSSSSSSSSSGGSSSSIQYQCQRHGELSGSVGYVAYFGGCNYVVAQEKKPHAAMLLELGAARRRHPFTSLDVAESSATESDECGTLAPEIIAALTLLTSRLHHRTFVHHHTIPVS